MIIEGNIIVPVIYILQVVSMHSRIFRYTSMLSLLAFSVHVSMRKPLVCVLFVQFKLFVVLVFQHLYLVVSVNCALWLVGYRRE